jgi:hypothetical protein
VEEATRGSARGSAAGKESMFRRVNEAIERGNWPGEEDEQSAFRCECADAECNRMIELTPAEYEDIRAHPRRFIVLPGHERPEIEDVVEVRGGYVVVEKRGSAGRQAADEDPRD